jgi:hypothetical protein
MPTLEEQIRELAKLRDEKDATRQAADDAKLAYDRAHQELWDRMDATGVDSVRIDGRLYSKWEPKVYGTVADKRVFTEWAAEHAPELIEPKPRESLINELVRLRVDNNEELPPGLNWYTKNTVGQRKG